MKIVRRNATRMITAIKAGVYTARRHDLVRDPAGAVSTPAAAWIVLAQCPDARLWDNEDGTYVVLVNGNLWHTLSIDPAVCDHHVAYTNVGGKSGTLLIERGTDRRTAALTSAASIRESGGMVHAITMITPTGTHEVTESTPHTATPVPEVHNQDDTAPAVTFHDKPAFLRKELGEGLTDEVADLSKSYLCAMRHDPKHTGVVGWREHEDENSRIRLEWHPYHEVQFASDAEPTRVCEDDAGWITTLADQLREAGGEESENSALRAELEKVRRAYITAALRLQDWDGECLHHDVRGLLEEMRAALRGA
ncbi:hypothetical protein [Actinosynnema sp. NPDC023587]|uniref:hypothetical protein n=1 Tax=Actinosynnema sp. NPDC023587 TaxID=3154695 RepID=UPI0033E5FDE7